MWSAAIVGVLVAVAVCLFLFWFFGTEIGTALRATGVNPQMIRAQGVNTDNMIVLGLLISNGFVGMSGALIWSIPRLCRRRHGYWYHRNRLGIRYYR